MRWIWNKLLTKECVVTLVAIIALTVLVSWFFIERSQHLQAENKKLSDRQLIIDRAILEGMKSIFDALPRPVTFTEVMK